MTQQNLKSEIWRPFEQWLHQQILQLSVDTLSTGLLTCTACEKVFGEYILEYKDEKFRLPAGETYAFLCFVQATAANSQ
ncbi:MAG: hypothetical protein HC886_07965 [Leptolyngbyaceae cyanobacterium SM1_1_3]|nr:hypothetical protein [Leptolyngbyaceae cyanobacterium SM1_1_3]NJN01261.1 hypothetical protein [Leptolyngbyaceae cyanobacterium RM1_1_2]NJO11532.1 hypothetical protein [Leptolyngbyaceae cyanobacterium SL_1_1]